MICIGLHFPDRLLLLVTISRPPFQIGSLPMSGLMPIHAPPERPAHTTARTLRPYDAHCAHYCPHTLHPHISHTTLGRTQTGSYQTGSYQKGLFIPPKPTLLFFCFLIRPRLYASDTPLPRGPRAPAACHTQGQAVSLWKTYHHIYIYIYIYI